MRINQLGFYKLCAGNKQPPYLGVLIKVFFLSPVQGGQTGCSATYGNSGFRSIDKPNIKEGREFGGMESYQLPRRWITRNVCE